MIAELFITEVETNGDMFSVVLALQGQPSAIAKEIAFHHADLTSLCHEGKLTSYTIIAAFLDKNGVMVR